MAAIQEAAVLAPTADIDSTEPVKTNKNKGFLRGLFNKAADMAGRAAVTNTLKIAAVTTLAGAGASSFVTIGTAALASGLGAAFYVYAKDTFADWRQARRDGRNMEWWNATRSRKVKIALLTGVAGGAFGAWLAGTDTFKAGLDFAKEYGGRALSMAMSNAHAVQPVAAIATVAPIAHDTIAAALPVADATPAVKPVTVLGKLWGMAMKSNQAHGKMMAQLLNADPDNVNSVSPQFLKDRAHDVLRLKDVPWQERLSLAHDLAEEAKARGNHQAVQFLKDLVKLEHGGPAAHFHAAAAHIVAAPEPVAVVAAPEPVAIVAPLEPVPPVVVPEVVVPEVTAPAIPDVAAPPSLQFSEAATCRLAAQGTDSAVDCTVNKASMQAGDYIGFVAAEDPTIKVTTLLAEGSTEVPTQSFLHERVIAEAVSRIDAVRAAMRLAAVPTP